MSYIGFLWECKCGHHEYGEGAPDQCLKCGDIECFEKVPEDLVEDREKDMEEELGLEDD